MTSTTPTQTRLRIDTAANWTAWNPVLADGEVGFERDTDKHKIGKDNLGWNDLEYATPDVDLSAYLTTSAASTTYLALAGGTLTGPLMLGTSTTGAAAGAIYRSANTLRYRDSTNTERLLLNATDNLANLANNTTALTNLAGGVAPTGTQGLVRSASPTLTGTVNVAALTASGTGTFNRVGVGTSSPSQAIHVLNSANSATQIVVQSTSNGSAATSAFRFQTDVGNAYYGMDGSGVGSIRAQRAFVYSDTANGVSLQAIHGSGIITFITGADDPANERVRISNSGLRVGLSGSFVSSILSATATLDFASIAASSFQDLTITVTGAASGDTVVINPIAGSATTDVVFTGWVSAANTVTIRASNVSATTARDPASGTFRATVIKF